MAKFSSAPIRNLKTDGGSRRDSCGEGHRLNLSFREGVAPKACSSRHGPRRKIDLPLESLAKQ